MSILQLRRYLSRAGAVATILPLVYPVGCLYFSTNSTNPATSLGFGTWSAFGAGKVPVGYLAADPDFGTDEATGGEKTHVLTEAELASHNHSLNRGTVTNASGNAFLRATVVDATTTGTDGSNTGHNNLQPFIVVRIWKRTA